MVLSNTGLLRRSQPISPVRPPANVPVKTADMQGFNDALRLPLKYLLFFLLVTIAAISVVESSAMALLSD